MQKCPSPLHHYCANGEKPWVKNISKSPWKIQPVPGTRSPHQNGHLHFERTWLAIRQDCTLPKPSCLVPHSLRANLPFLKPRGRFELLVAAAWQFPDWVSVDLQACLVCCLWIYWSALNLSVASISNSLRRAECYRAKFINVCKAHQDLSWANPIIF